MQTLNTSLSLNQYSDKTSVPKCVQSTASLVHAAGPAHVDRVRADVRRCISLTSGRSLCKITQEREETGKEIKRREIAERRRKRERRDEKVRTRGHESKETLNAAIKLLSTQRAEVTWRGPERGERGKKRQFIMITRPTNCDNAKGMSEIRHE